MKQLESINPANDEIIWTGEIADEKAIDDAISQARKAFPKWTRLSLTERSDLIAKFIELIKSNQDSLSKILSEETGKVLWEAKTEITAMINKFAISQKAYQERTGEKQEGLSHTRHRAHGVIAVFGPYNFPAHIPNGHIIPALLAGNTIVIKPSELTPKISEEIHKLWIQVLPSGVMNLVQGKAETGIYLSKHDGFDGLFFTGSSRTGLSLHQSFANKPNKILALELGGNNPLLISEVNDLDAAVYLTIQSAFITAGQRCTCARRLILIDNQESKKFLVKFIETSSNIKISHPNDSEAFMGPVISKEQAAKLMLAHSKLTSQGAKTLLEMKQITDLGSQAYISPGIIDSSEINTEDEEFFGPLVKIKKVKDFNAAIEEANNTKYGLSAGLLSDNKNLYEQFYYESRAGLINWNNQLTGASSSAPFGGTGFSGNHRPSAYYAADYCSYPVASMESEQLSMPAKLAPGIKIEGLHA